MIRLICAQLSLLILAVATARGAEPPARPEQPAAPGAVAKPVANDATQPVIPKREIKFSVPSDVPVGMPMTLADPKLLEQRYQAEFNLILPLGFEPLSQIRRRIGDIATMGEIVGGRGGRGTAISGGPSGRGMGGRSPRESANEPAADPIIELDNLLREHFQLPGAGPRPGAGLRPGERPQPHRGEQLGFYHSLFSSIREERRPPKELVDALDQGEPYLRNQGWTGSQNQVKMPYRILAPTPERAKELVQALVQLYDYGISYPMQEEFLRQRQEAAKELVQAQEEVKKVQAVIADCDKQLESLKTYEDIGKEALATYRAQQRMLDVDLSGIKARIDACNKILERRKELSASRVEQVETVKIAAEIELVGLEAKQSAIATIVRNGERRTALLEKKHENNLLLGGRPGMRGLEAGMRGLEEEIAKCTATRKAWEACPIENGLVTIVPIKWEPAKAK